MKTLNYLLKTGLLFIISLVICSTSCKKKEGCTDPNAVNFDSEAKKDNGSCITITESRKALLIEFTAAWCGPCGTWGTPAFKQMLKNRTDKMIGIASHGSKGRPDGMTNKYSIAFIRNFPFNGFPSFDLGNKKIVITQAIDTYIKAEFAKTIIANGTMTVKMFEDKIEVKSRVKFFQETTGDYYLGIYVIESGIDGTKKAGYGFDQVGDTGPGYRHDYVLRGGAVENAFGELIANGTISQGYSISKEYNILIKSSWVADSLEVVGIIFEQDSTTFKVINAFEGHHLTQSE